ncbi:hypothetical protein K1720_01410 [Thermococcus argininiproducens]|uniref:Uncharacterized protein n=1 Tax=Thermococcus argininiproducens TaxID=2866384 RepID=A0A9E7SDL8_9EURY|nr:hypothetical protein [Thermococcus argininiproducens]USH00163.1 hypothetical protein K1720_01410 [Thermococcus argininiproducens]
MKGKTIAGLALLLGIVMVGAFISGCIDQGNVTKTVTRSNTTEPTQTAPNEWEAEEEKLTSLIDTYDKEITDAKEKLMKVSFELDSPEIDSWEAQSKKLLEMAKAERDPSVRVLILQDAAKFKYYQLLNLRTLAGIGAVERAYWENATTGEPIEAFYNVRGSFFYASESEVSELGRAEMVEKMGAVKGYRVESLEIYHFGTGSTLRSIREGGRTIGAGQAAFRLGAENGRWLKAFGNSTPPAIRLVDLETGKTIAWVKPDENGFYMIPPVNTTILGIPDDDGFCYRPLPLDTNTMNTIPEEPEDPLICPSPEIAPFIFEPIGTDVTEPVPFEDAYVMPGEYTVTVLVMKADLKQLAEQLVNVNARIGIEKTDIRRGFTTIGDLRSGLANAGIVRNELKASIETDVGSTCSCTFSPLLRSIFGKTFGGEAFGEVSEPEVINVTDFGNGPYIPVAWAGLENYSSVVKVYVMRNSNGETLVAVSDPSLKTKDGELNGKRLAPSYLDRVFLEVITGRNPQTGKEIKVIAFKILNTDGTVGIRATGIVNRGNVRVLVFPAEWS